MEGERRHDAGEVMRRRAANINPEQLGAGRGSITAWCHCAKHFKACSEGGGTLWVTRNNEEGARWVARQRRQDGGRVRSTFCAVGNNGKVHHARAHRNRLGRGCVGRRVRDKEAARFAARPELGEECVSFSDGGGA